MLQNILKKPEQYRNRMALGLSVSLSLVILVTFGFFKGYVSFGNGNIANTSSSVQTANVVFAESVPSPVQNTKKTFMAAFDEIGNKYKEFTDSISDVLVPFVTGIEVYERK